MSKSLDIIKSLIIDKLLKYDANKYNEMNDLIESKYLDFDNISSHLPTNGSSKSNGFHK